MTASERRPTYAGPVLNATDVGRAVLEAIRASHPEMRVVDRGAYYRVLVPGTCRLTRSAVERITGGSFHFPSDLEAVMPTFQGSLHVQEDWVEWRAES